MAISSDAPFGREAVATEDSSIAPENGAVTANSTAANGAVTAISNSDVNETSMALPKQSADHSPKNLEDVDGTAEFEGEVNTNNELPTQATLKKIQNLPILDVDGKSIPFKNLYTGPNVARRVLIVFIRHFFCGNCQEYIRTLASSISPASLLQLPTPTFIAIVGHGSPSLIPMWQSETSCPFPVYADPTKKLYNELGMLRTLNLGERPEYQRRDLMSLMMGSFVQSIKQLKSGKAFQGGDYQQVGGEFMFEPVNMSTPIGSTEDEQKELGGRNGLEGMLENGYVEEKRVTWCHRMRNTRDHAEIPEVREVLGLDEEDKPVKNPKRWKKAIVERKGTGLSLGSRSSMGFSRKLASLDDGGSSGRQSSDKLMDSTNTVQ